MNKLILGNNLEILKQNAYIRVEILDKICCQI